MIYVAVSLTPGLLAHHGLFSLAGEAQRRHLYSLLQDRVPIIELSGSFPLKAEVMDLFHLMSVWQSRGEQGITGWRCFNWQDDNKKRFTAMFQSPEGEFKCGCP